MRNKGTLANIDNSDPSNYPNGRIKNNTGSGNGTPVNEFVYGDIHEAKDKLMRLYGISYNGLPDNETNGYQLIEALIALASKNDFLLNLTDVAGVISLPLKLGKLKDNEAFITKATFDKTTQTTIKGSDGVTKTVSFIGDFNNNEYVRMINTATNVTLVRMVDGFNTDTVVSALGYLKAATGSEVIAGIINNKAVTPESFLEAFAEYVLGVESDNFLADAARNGLYPKEHFTIVENLGDNPVKNVGGFSGLDIGSGSIGSTYPVFGDVTAVTILGVDGQGTIVRVDISNAMTDTNYFVRVHVKSESASSLNDRTFTAFSTRSYTTTSFNFQISESSATVQNLKITFEVVKL